MEKDTSLERLAAAICPIVLDALRGLAAHPEGRDAAWEMEGNVQSSIMEAAAAAYAQALQAGIRAPTYRISHATSAGGRRGSRGGSGRRSPHIQEALRQVMR